jgi:raffinose/stachyose/melibiose transport system substrate-binding protein
MKNDIPRILVIFALILIGSFTTFDEADAGSEPEKESKVLKIWHYESESGAMGTAWKAAMKKFEETHPGVKIEFENKGFEQIRQTAQMILNSDQAPDVMEYNKGNASAGMLAKQGLLTDLTEVAKQKGWDKLLSPSLQTTCRYDSDGIMGSGKWYGVTNYGEYVMVYYNKDMFAKEGIKVPKTIEEFEAAMDKFQKKGIVPIALGAAEYPAQHIFYELVLQKADRAFINDFQLYENEVDFKNAEMVYGAKKMREWAEKGYISNDSISLKAEDMGLLFANGKSPIMISGSWWYGRLIDEITNFEWGVFLFPGNKLHPGSGGNIWVVPSKSKNKQLAYEFIDLTMQTDIQSILGKEGGIPVNADLSQISDPKVKDLISNFNEIVKTDGLAFYPDWPAAGYYGTLVGGVQELMQKTKNPDQFLDAMGRAYLENKMQ